MSTINHSDKKIQSFLRKTMAGLEENPDSWCWDSTGSVFFIKDEKPFASVLYRIFRNRRVQSFIQQLLHLGFYKFPNLTHVDGQPIAHAFSHPSFLRGKQDLLQGITKIGAPVATPNPLFVPHFAPSQDVSFEHHHMYVSPPKQSPLQLDPDPSTLTLVSPPSQIGHSQLHIYYRNQEIHYSHGTGLNDGDTDDNSNYHFGLPDCGFDNHPSVAPLDLPRDNNNNMVGSIGNKNSLSDLCLGGGHQDEFFPFPPVPTRQSKNHSMHHDVSKYPIANDRSRDGIYPKDDRYHLVTTTSTNHHNDITALQLTQLDALLDRIEATKIAVMTLLQNGAGYQLSQIQSILASPGCDPTLGDQNQPVRVTSSSTVPSVTTSKNRNNNASSATDPTSVSWGSQSASLLTHHIQSAQSPPCGATALSLNTLASPLIVPIPSSSPIEPPSFTPTLSCSHHNIDTLTTHPHNNINHHNHLNNNNRVPLLSLYHHHHNYDHTHPHNDGICASAFPNVFDVGSAVPQPPCATSVDDHGIILAPCPGTECRDYGMFDSSSLHQPQQPRQLAAQLPLLSPSPPSSSSLSSQSPLLSSSSSSSSLSHIPSMLQLLPTPLFNTPNIASHAALSPKPIEFIPLNRNHVNNNQTEMKIDSIINNNNHAHFLVQLAPPSCMLQTQHDFTTIPPPFTSSIPRYSTFQQFHNFTPQPSLLHHNIQFPSTNPQHPILNQPNNSSMLTSIDLHHQSQLLPLGVKRKCPFPYDACDHSDHDDDNGRYPILLPTSPFPQPTSDTQSEFNPQNEIIGPATHSMSSRVVQVQSRVDELLKMHADSMNLQLRTYHLLQQGFERLATTGGVSAPQQSNTTNTAANNGTNTGFLPSLLVQDAPIRSRNTPNERPLSSGGNGNFGIKTQHENNIADGNDTMRMRDEDATQHLSLTRLRKKQRTNPASYDDSIIDPKMTADWNNAYIQHLQPELHHQQRLLSNYLMWEPPRDATPAIAPTSTLANQHPQHISALNANGDLGPNPSRIHHDLAEIEDSIQYVETTTHTEIETTPTSQRSKRIDSVCHHQQQQTNIPTSRRTSSRIQALKTQPDD